MALARPNKYQRPPATVVPAAPCRVTVGAVRWGDKVTIHPAPWGAAPRWKVGGRESREARVRACVCGRRAGQRSGGAGTGRGDRERCKRGGRRRHHGGERKGSAGGAVAGRGGTPPSRAAALPPGSLTASLEEHTPWP